MRSITCPICDSGEYSSVLKTKDFTTSQEQFEIVTCKGCGLAMTTPRPDKVSITKYYQTNTYISHRDQSTNIVDSIYLQARRYALDWKIKNIQQVNSKAKTILDYGCGTGEFIKHCRSKGYAVYGYEPSTEARTIAIQKNPQSIVYQLDELKEPIDIITLWHVLEHVHDLRETLAHLTSKLNHNGAMLIAVPNHLSWDAKHFKSYWAGYDTPRHLWHFDQQSMGRLLKTSNLKVVRTIPMKLDAFYISLVSHQYKTGSKSPVTSLATGFWSGLWSNVKAKHTGEYSSLIYLVKHA